MEKKLKKLLKEELFFLKGAEESAVEEFLGGLAEAETFPKGAVVCSPEKSGKGLGIIIEGRLEIEAGCNTVSIRQMEPPEVFGAASIFGGNGFVSTIRAATNVKIIFISEEQLTALMRRDFVVAQNYIGFLSEKVRFLNHRIENFTAGCSSEALWDYLVRCANCGEELPPPPNMTQLAKMLNMGRTSLYRAVEELEKSGRLSRREDKWILNYNLKGEI